MNKAHSFPLAAKFWAELQNLPFATKFTLENFTIFIKNTLGKHDTVSNQQQQLCFLCKWTLHLIQIQCNVLQREISVAHICFKSRHHKLSVTAT